MKNPFVIPERPHIHVTGPWPFVTLRTYTIAGHRFTWLARAERKGIEGSLRVQERGPVWRRPEYNRSIAALFALGSLLFMLGAALSLLPPSAAPPTAAINMIFAAGSVPFTLAAYLQHFQAANAPAFTPDPATHPGRRRISLIGWHPRSAGWWSTLTQLVGTLDFNFNTFDALRAPDGWFAQDLVIWVPGMLGSIMFLVSSYLAFIETSHGYWSWRPASLDWQIVFANLAGSVAFMTASTLAYVPPGHEAAWIGDVANVHLFVGGLGFLAGAVLMFRESRR